MHLQYEDEQRGSLNTQTARATVSPDSTWEQPQEFLHEVAYGDTLEGLALEYDVPIGQIKRRNHIEGDSIYHLKFIVIPDPKATPTNRERTEDMKIEEFMAHMSETERDEKVARYYLTDKEWKVSEAVREYREDLEWERKNKHQLMMKRVGPGQFGDIQLQRFYDKQELLRKKEV